MGYNYCKDHRSGITYVYEVTKEADNSTGRARTSRKLVGKLDDTGKIVPTSGRKGRLPKTQDTEHAGDARKETEALKKEIAELKRTISALRRDNQELVKGLEDLLSKARR